MPKGRGVAIAGSACLLAATVGCAQGLREAELRDDERAPIRVKNGKFRIESDYKKWEKVDETTWKFDQDVEVSQFVVTTYGSAQACDGARGTEVAVTFKPGGGNEAHLTFTLVGTGTERTPQMNARGTTLEHADSQERKLRVQGDPPASIFKVVVTGQATTNCVFPGDKNALVEICLEACQ